MEQRQSDWQRRIFAEVNVAIWHISKTGMNKMCNKVIVLNKGFPISLLIMKQLKPETFSFIVPVHF